jgi:hypothetical protein
VHAGGDGERMGWELKNRLLALVFWIESQMIAVSYVIWRRMDILGSEKRLLRVSVRINE